MSHIDQITPARTIEHVPPQKTIEEIAQEAGVSGDKNSSYKVTIELENNENQAHNLARYLQQAKPFSGLSSQIINATRSLREGLGERLK